MLYCGTPTALYTMGWGIEGWEVLLAMHNNWMDGMANGGEEGSGGWIGYFIIVVHSQGVWG